MDIYEMFKREYIMLEKGERPPEITSPDEDVAFWVKNSKVMASVHMIGDTVALTVWGAKQPRINVDTNSRGDIHTMWLVPDEGAPTVTLSTGNHTVGKQLVFEFEVAPDEEE